MHTKLSKNTINFALSFKKDSMQKHSKHKEMHKDSMNKEMHKEVYHKPP